MKKCLLLINLLLIAQFAFSQQHLFLGFSGDYGVFQRSFQEQRDVLRTKKLGTMVAGNISIQYRIANRITLESGIGFHRQRWALKDHNFEKRHPGFVVDIVNRNTYNTFFFGIQYSKPINPKTFLYFQATGLYNLTGGASSLTEHSYFVQDNEDVDITTNYSNNYYSVTPEVGLQWFTKKNRLVSIGMKYNYAFGNLMEGSYKVSSGGNVIQEDKFVANGSYLTFNFKYNFLLGYKPKKERPVKQKEIRDDKENQVPDDLGPVVKENKPKTDQVVGGRDYYITNKIKVKSSNVTIKVWDHSIEDGDIISLNINGNWIIENYTLTKAKKEFTVTLKEGENHLVLYALNLGKYKPNTASISVHDGNKEQIVVLESNLEQSGALEILVKP
ncbi:MAG TPA: hypothetical protein VIK89_16640 [Cytophagaceae bacterium]